MHFENFSDHEMRILNPKPSFAGDVKKRNEIQWKWHQDRLGLKTQPQGRSIKGRLQKNNIALWQDLFSYKYTRLTYGILCREYKKRMRKEKETSMRVRMGKMANASQSSEYHPMWQMSWQNTQGKWHNSIPLVYAIKCILNKK